jgi:hypothetical protein
MPANFSFGVQGAHQNSFFIASREKEYTRERTPLDWAATQNNLGNALRALGKRRAGRGSLRGGREQAHDTARLEEEAVVVSW